MSLRPALLAQVAEATQQVIGVGNIDVWVWDGGHGQSISRNTSRPRLTGIDICTLVLDSALDCVDSAVAGKSGLHLAVKVAVSATDLVVAARCRSSRSQR